MTERTEQVPGRVRPAEAASPRSLAHGLQRATPYLFLLPALTLVGGWLLWPFLRTAYLSFTDFNGIGEPSFVGVENYTTFARDSVLLDSFRNTLFWVVGTLVLPVGLGLLIAVMSYELTGGALYRLPFLLPYAISGTAIGVMWEFMLRSSGALNSLLTRVGLESWERSWLLRPPVNTWSMIVASTWQSVGVSVLLFLVGLQVVPRDPVDAARLDGADGWRLFRDITFPLLRPMTIVVIGISLANSLKTFDVIWVMTQGGPYRSSETLAVTMYRETFLIFRHGYGAGIAVVLSVIVFGVSWLYLSRTLRSR
ncbi:MAG: sugar ABC transporter permease [Gemmatimonadota bacterium]|nr:sugar ABC transporter permease [Gemmatimonadota bacterium]